MPVSFKVEGVVPAPKGSYRAINVGGRAIMVASGDDKRKLGLKSWDQAVKLAATQAVGPRSSPLYVGVPLYVSVTFRLPRPAGHWGARGIKPSAPAWPFTKPDMDKLERSTFDSLTGIVYDDDSRLCMKQVAKVYALPGQEGATITVEELSPQKGT